MSSDAPTPGEEEIANAEPQAPLKRKTSPSPIPMARDMGAAPRPLSPIRRAAVPLGLAGLVSVAAAAAAVNAAADPPCPVSGAAPSGPYARFSSGLDNIVHRFLDPTPTRTAGEMMPVTPASVTPPSGSAPVVADTSAPMVPVPNDPASINPAHDTGATPAPSTAPSAKRPPVTKHIDPIPTHPRLAGKPMSPNPHSI